MGCGDIITIGTTNATGCKLSQLGWSCGECEYDENLKYFKVEEIEDDQETSQTK